MNPGDLIRKDPQSVEPYGFDWTDYLAELGSGVVISTSEWIITALHDEDPADLETSNESIVGSDLQTQAYFTGGTVNQRYKVTNRITTDSSPTVTDDRSVTMLIQQK